MAVPEIGAYAKGQELLDYCSLGAYCRCRTRSTTAGVLHGKMKRSGPGFVFASRVTACAEKTAHGGSAPRPDGAMQGSSAVLVLQMNVGAVGEEATDGLHLPLGIPRRTAEETVRSIVQRAASAMICCRVWVGAGRQQQSNNFNTITGRGQMQCRISHVNPMKYLRIVQLRLPNEARCQPAIHLEQRLDLPAVVINDCPEQIIHPKEVVALAAEREK